MGMHFHQNDEIISYVTGIDHFREQVVFLTWMTVSRNDPPEITGSMAVLDGAGALVGILEGELIGFELRASAGSGTVFMAYDLPFPHVKEMRVLGIDIP